MKCNIPSAVSILIICSPRKSCETIPLTIPLTCETIPLTIPLQCIFLHYAVGRKKNRSDDAENCKVCTVKNVQNFKFTSI